MDAKEYNKLKDKFNKQIEWGKTVNGAWSGTARFKDGYQYTLAASPEMKMRESKSLVKEMLFDRAMAIADERGTEIVFQK